MGKNEDRQKLIYTGREDEYENNRLEPDGERRRTDHSTKAQMDRFLSKKRKEDKASYMNPAEEVLPQNQGKKEVGSPKSISDKRIDVNTAKNNFNEIETSELVKPSELKKMKIEGLTR
ncbi:MAG: hypothetical protein AABY27_05045 [Pseudomonadota bacterium]